MYQKTSKISILILAIFTSAAFLNAYEPWIATSPTSTIQTVGSELPVNEASFGIADPHQLFSLALVSVAIMAGLFFIVNFHLHRRKKIIAVQKMNVYQMETPSRRSPTELTESISMQESMDQPGLHSHLKVS